MCKSGRVSELKMLTRSGLWIESGLSFVHLDEGALRLLRIRRWASCCIRKQINKQESR